MEHGIGTFTRITNTRETMTILEYINIGLIVVLVLMPIIALPLSLRSRKHPACGVKGKPTGEGGNKYEQFYCKKCEKTFWLTYFWIEEDGVYKDWRWDDDIKEKPE